MGSQRFLKSQIGLQTAFGTPITPTIEFPGVVEYEDGREHHVAEYDSGTWTPAAITALAQKYATLKATGTAFFEMLPVFLNSGFEDVAPSGADPYTHTYTVSPAAVAVPKPLTWVTGAVGENIGGTGPAVKLPDLYLQKLKLSGNINDKLCKIEAELFGTDVDDNSGAGFAFTAALTYPATLEAMNALLGQINIQDATSTGGDFATMTAFACAVPDWTLNIDTGLQPLWCVCDNKVTFSGIRYELPAAEFEATIRTSATNYALVKGKSDARTYQELQVKINGSATRAATFNLTGRWTECKSAHARENNEVVMKAKFTAETPWTQTTTPHWFAAIVVSKHNWT
jgi:hypothetical protein